LKTLKGYLDWVSLVAFSPDGKLVVLGLGDNIVKLRDAVTGAALQTLEIGVVINTLLFSTLG
jgi:WD40 repeat protein